MTADMETGLIAGPEDPRWMELRKPFADDVLEWKPQPVKATPKDNAERRAASGRCVKGGRATNGDMISADDFYCSGYHVRAVHIAYVGHAELTMRLNDVCSPAGWDWQPMVLAPSGLPGIVDGTLWIRLTILGVEKLGFGDSGDNKGANATKEVIGDALRNAAMRFGIATYLWSKSERSLALKYADVAEADAANPPPQQAPRPAGPLSGPVENLPLGEGVGNFTPPPQGAGPRQEPAADDELTLAKRRHRAAIVRAHPEWDANAKSEAIANAFAAERTDHNGQPVTLQTATAADWAWLATYWEDEADENEATARSEDDAARAEQAPADERADAEADAADLDGSAS